jgi:hypothetical protein
MPRRDDVGEWYPVEHDRLKVELILDQRQSYVHGRGYEGGDEAGQSRDCQNDIPLG